MGWENDCSKANVAQFAVHYYSERRNHRQMSHKRPRKAMRQQCLRVVDKQINVGDVMHLLKIFAYSTG